MAAVCVALWQLAVLLGEGVVGQALAHMPGLSWLRSTVRLFEQSARSGRLVLALHRWRALTRRSSGSPSASAELQR